MKIACVIFSLEYGAKIIEIRGYPTVDLFHIELVNRHRLLRSKVKIKKCH